MPRKKATHFIVVMNETRLLLFVYVRHVSLNKKLVTEVFIFNRPPDIAAFNNNNLHKIMPGKNFRWNISPGPRWLMRNKTRYQPLDWRSVSSKENGQETVTVKILPTNNHISIEDINLLEKMGETVEAE